MMTPNYFGVSITFTFVIFIGYGQAQLFGELCFFLHIYNVVLHCEANCVHYVAYLIKSGL